MIGSANVSYAHRTSARPRIRLECLWYARCICIYDSCNTMSKRHEYVLERLHEQRFNAAPWDVTIASSSWEGSATLSSGSNSSHRPQGRLGSSPM